MKHIISYSGGLGSAITADIVCRTYGKENVILLFADTLVEDEDLYRFNREVVANLGTEFIRIFEGRTPWQVFNDVKFIGNSRIDPCSKHLKRDLINNWIKNNYASDEVTIWVGIDCSEEHRLKPVVERHKPYNYRSILIENDMILTNTYKQDWCDALGIEMPRLYRFGFSHNNCGGFCVKAGLGQFKKLYEFLPEVYLANEKEEQDAIANNPNLRPFLKKMVKGKTKYITMKAYRQNYLETNKVSEDEANEFGGCGCAL